ncbi:MAG: hypothetical protein KDK07_05730 [Bauldia sp.]|nr:hypothetical protein [Bauldia sp.]
MPAFSPLADAFDSIAAADWRAAANRRDNDLGRLTSYNIDGLAIEPVYARRTDPVLATRPAGSTWTVMNRVEIAEVGEIQRNIVTALGGGAAGLEIAFASEGATFRRILDGEADLGALLAGLDVPIRIDAGEATARLLSSIRSTAPAPASAFDAISARAAGRLSRSIEDCFAETGALIVATDRGEEGWPAFAADGRPWHDAGASEVQELAIVVGSAVGAIRALTASGLEPERAAAHLGVILTADADQFLTIAKFRAARLLFARLSEVTGLTALRPPIHAQTSWRMLTRREPTMNLIRGTTAAFAAAAGGADSLTVLPPMLVGAEFSARMARNTQTILREESTLFAASDPGAGSGAIEALTDELAAAAWEAFARIEGDGGLIAAIDTGSLPRAVAAMGEKRLAQVRRRQLPIVGVNVNVDPDATIPATALPVGAVRGPLRAMRLSEPFEDLCERNLDAAGRRRRIFLLAPKGGRSADPAAAADAFAAGGFEIVSADTADGDHGALAAFAASGAGLGCIIADPENVQSAISAAASLGAAGARQVVIAAPSREGIPPGACDAVLTPDTDIVALMSEMLDRIAEQHQNGQG